jgi:hypothetical protein
MYILQMLWDAAVAEVEGAPSGAILIVRQVVVEVQRR